MKSTFSFPSIFVFCLVAFGSFGQAAAQRLAILVPDKTPLAENFVDDLRETLSSGPTVLDNSLSETAFKSVAVENTFNMTTAESKRLAAVIGCDYFVIVRTGELRRSSFEKPEYYEAFSVSYLVSGRTGRLVFWELKNFIADTPAEAKKVLLKSVGDYSANIVEKIRTGFKVEIAAKSNGSIEEVPSDDSAETKTFRPPMPYKRIKPEYPGIAYLYGARGTVDISVDVDEKGTIMRTEIVRWAGYGLDEAVDDAVRKMNWRPAERSGKPLPMRVLLRYNFTKIEKE